RVSCIGRCPKNDTASRGGELDGVSDKVRQNLKDAFPVGMNLQAGVNRALELYRLRLGERSQDDQRLGDHVVERLGLRLHGEAAGLYACQVQEVVNQRVHVADGPLNAVD